MVKASQANQIHTVHIPACNECLTLLLCVRVCESMYTAKECDTQTELVST